MRSESNVRRAQADAERITGGNAVTRAARSYSSRIPSATPTPAPTPPEMIRAHTSCRSRMSIAQSTLAEEAAFSEPEEGADVEASGETDNTQHSTPHPNRDLT